MNSFKFYWALMMVSFVLSGCSFNPDKYSHDILFAKQDRAVSCHPEHCEKIPYDFKMKSDSYIIGVEKSYGVDNYKTVCSDESFEKRNSELCNVVSNHTPNQIWGKPTVLTHIVKSSLDSDCILFSVYDNIQNKNIQPCSNNRTKNSNYMQEATSAIDLLNEDIRLRIKEKHPTHLFLVATGWNTPQGESIQNYNDLLGHIKEAAQKNNEKFEPLVVGITWHSYIENLIRGTGDFPIQQNDADEVGLFWAGAILHKVLEPIGTEYQIPVRLIGHSFGCRITTSAMASKNLYQETSNYTKPVSYGLQCAFSGNRFLPKGKDMRYEDDNLEKFDEVSAKQFYTISKYDVALTQAFPDYVGTSKFFERSSNEKLLKNRISQIILNSLGKYEPELDCNGDTVTLIDASKIIKDTPLGTGGGSHSDVWDEEAGSLIWDLIKVCEHK